MSGVVSVGSEHAGDLRLDADVVVVGTGAGGAVVAAELAEAGQRVVVLEEGPFIGPETVRSMRPSEHMRTAWRDGGMTVAVGVGRSPTINVTMGRCVGGSTMLAGGVCFRTPERVLRTWSDELGLSMLTPDELAPCFEAVEREISVAEVPVAMRSRSTELFAAGAEAMGYRLSPLRRNTRGCQGCGRCNFGCPKGAKQSTALTFLPRALRAGAEIWSDCLVERITIEGGRAVGVRGRLLGSAGRRARRQGGVVAVRARRVVIAAGSYHSPLLLMRSGIGRRHHQVGRHMTLHPGFRLFARFDEPVRGWRGALQSAYSDAFEEEGITLVGLFIPAGVLAATMHGFGPELMDRCRRIPELAVFGGIIHDEGGGRVRPGLGREPVVTYRMSDRDRARVPGIIKRMGETFLAAGAREVFPPVLGQRGLDADAFRRFDFSAVPPIKLECSSQHPLGTCRMGSRSDCSVVDSDARVWDVDELFVADGSILPTSLGVNPMLSIMAMATRIAWQLRERPLPPR